MNQETASRILEAVRNLPPAPSGLSKLHPVRDAIVTLRARNTSYEQISAFLKKQGFAVCPSAVGYFVRQHCSRTEVNKLRRILLDQSGVTVMPRAVTAPIRFQPSTRGERPAIARDDF
ncbi:hypothetical protein Ga0100231_016650 [Opitutaceae bacterium TAV4]|nr:hypothetical protein Ga0100231_016650 [Opitutaceae bacterium TAV4]RRK00992.1 hypothetical protein Ga0100230_024875 [Opitutaceae bacterium TAV3]RRK02158.1 hypothetical protein Ga0100230_002845 [Opitutaceae bacterium TAV3]